LSTLPAEPQSRPRRGPLISEVSPGHSSRRLLLWTVLIALAVRLIVVAFVYQDFLDPQRDHWLFGFENGRIARSIVEGHGFGNAWGNTGPTAILTPVIPYLLAGIFALFGVYTRTSALVMLALGSLFAALTCVPIFFVARKTSGSELRAAPLGCGSSFHTAYISPRPRCGTIAFSRWFSPRSFGSPCR